MENTKRRVVVTGIGVASAYGPGADIFWKSLLEGKSAISTIERIPLEGHSVHIAGEIKDFESWEKLDPKEAKRMDRYTQFAVVAADEAVKDSKVSTENTDPYRYGVIVGSAAGGFDTFEKQHHNIMDKGPTKCSPFTVPMLIADMGADSICIKDMAALLTPYETNELVTKIKETVNLPIQIHTHYTSGLASMCIIKAVEAGADIIDTAMSPLALGTSLAPTESIVAAFSNTIYDTGINLSKLSHIRDYFMKLRQKYIEKDLIDTRMLTVDAKALIYQVPGGMLSNLLSQLKQAGKEDKFDEVLEEVPKVRSDAGYPPLVTPTSQIVGTQAVYNVIMGERYKMCTNEFKSLVSGKYGKTPIPIDKNFRLKITGNQEVINCRTADLIDPELSSLREEISPLMEQEEDVLSYAQFPKVAKDFFKKRRDRKYSINSKIYDSKKKIHPF